MPGIGEIRKDVRQEFARYATGKLDKAARAVQSEVFDVTIGKFAKNAARQRRPIDVWAIPKFKSFILNETKKIAKEASKKERNGFISGKVLFAASVKVMKRTQKFCRIALKKGKIADVRAGHFTTFAPGQSDGEVCSTFLASQVF